MRVVVDAHPARRAGKMLTERLEAALHTPVLLMLSGGSSLSVLAHVSEHAVSEHTTITVLDERLSVNEAKYNFTELSRTHFFALAQEAGARFIDTRPKGEESGQETTIRFRNALAAWRSDYRDGVVISTMGVGTDGHTAGILPFPEDPERFALLFERPHVVEFSVPPEKNPYQHRMTVTLPFLRDEVDQAIMYAMGEEKRNALERVLAPAGALSETPARIVHEMKEVAVITDLDIVSQT